MRHGFCLAWVVWHDFLADSFTILIGIAIGALHCTIMRFTLHEARLWTMSKNTRIESIGREGRGRAKINRSRGKEENRDRGCR